MAEFDSVGILVARYVYGTRAHLPDYVVKSDTVYRIISDHLGSVRLVVNAVTGAVAQRIDFDAYGRDTLDTNLGFQCFGYAGGLRDATTGLMRFGVRDYDPGTGRWLARDPLLFAGGDQNLYAYAHGDPINTIDVDGRMPIDMPPGPWYIDIKRRAHEIREEAEREARAKYPNQWKEVESYRHAAGPKRIAEEFGVPAGFASVFAYEFSQIEWERLRNNPCEWSRDTANDILDGLLGVSGGDLNDIAKKGAGRR